MDNVQAIFIVGAVIFGIGAIATGIAFSIFVGRAYNTAERLVAAGQINSARDVHWLNSIYIYFVLFTTYLLFTGLYATNATYSGFELVAPWRIVQWLRWPVLAFAGAIYIGALAFFLTEDGDATWNRRQPQSVMRAQSFFIVLYYFLAYLAIAAATLVAATSGKIVLMVFSVVLFALSLILFLVPFNKCDGSGHNPQHPHDYVFFTGNDTRRFGNAPTATPHLTVEERGAVITTYRVMFVLFVIFAYAINVVIWLLSYSNGVTTVLGFQGEVIAYLVGDILFPVVFTLALLFMTLVYDMKTIAIHDKQGHTSYAAPPSSALGQQQQQLKQQSFGLSLRQQMAVQSFKSGGGGLAAGKPHQR